MRDIVYILGKGSMWSNDELRYSLRSLEQLGRNYGKVFLIGEKPDFISDEVIFISDPDMHNNKARNIHEKIVTASFQKEISDDFVLMNDDYYFIQDYDFADYEYNYQYTLQQTLKLLGKNIYAKHVLATIKQLQNPKAGNFDTHYPFVINKELYLLQSSKIDWNVKFGYLTKTMYVNNLLNHSTIDIAYRIKRKSDCLMYKPGQVLPNFTVISVSDRGLTDEIKEMLIEKFPNKSKFEK